MSYKTGGVGPSVWAPGSNNMPRPSFTASAIGDLDSDGGPVIGLPDANNSSFVSCAYFHPVQKMVVGLGGLYKSNELE